MEVVQFLGMVPVFFQNGVYLLGKLLNPLVEMVVVLLGGVLELVLVMMEELFLVLYFLVKMVKKIFLLLVFLVKMLDPLMDFPGILFDISKRILEIVM